MHSTVMAQHTTYKIMPRRRWKIRHKFILTRVLILLSTKVILLKIHFNPLTAMLLKPNSSFWTGLKK